ncbi:MAG: hypothetical protein ACE5EC_02430 [Phycisphaerae bacterium]
MLQPGEMHALARFKDALHTLPASQQGRLAALVFDAERRMKALNEEADRTRVELARIRGKAPIEPNP